VLAVTNINGRTESGTERSAQRALNKDEELRSVWCRPTRSHSHTGSITKPMPLVARAMKRNLIGRPFESRMVSIPISKALANDVRAVGAAPPDRIIFPMIPSIANVERSRAPSDCLCQRNTSESAQSFKARLGETAEALQSTTGDLNRRIIAIFLDAHARLIGEQIQKADFAQARFVSVFRSQIQIQHLLDLMH
jgi:hypothetical protein